MMRWGFRIFPIDSRLKKWQGAYDVVQVHDRSGQMVVNLALVHLPGAIHHNRAQRTNKRTGCELEPKADKRWKKRTLKREKKK